MSARHLVRTLQLGDSYPGRQHSLMGQIPTWDDMVEFGQGRPHILAATTHGYPRSILHPDVRFVRVSPFDFYNKELRGNHSSVTGSKLSSRMEAKVAPCYCCPARRLHFHVRNTWCTFWSKRRTWQIMWIPSSCILSTSVQCALTTVNPLCNP